MCTELRRLACHIGVWDRELRANKASCASSGDDIPSCCPSTRPQSAVCAQMPIFASRDAAQRWLSDHPGVAILDLQDASEIARAYAETR
jgi:hypothetical protein